MLIADSEYARYILSLHKAGLCSEQPLNNLYIHRLWIFFWDEPFLSRLYEIYLSIKDLENWAEFNLLQNLHLIAQKSVCARNFGPLGENGANFSLQLSSRTQLAKINSKKYIAENQWEKHKKWSLGSVKVRFPLFEIKFFSRLSWLLLSAVWSGSGPTGAVWSGPLLFVKVDSKAFQQMAKQLFAVIDALRVKNNIKTRVHSHIVSLWGT